MTYRADIDGLRAIAVVAVMLFHAGVPGFSGGYVGVDVFFVISGFLITSIILNKAQRQEFSFLEFYDRRAKRILPALTFVVLATALAAWFFLLPAELATFGKSMAAIGAFSSNIFFWTEAGYFAGPAHETPLLHTWSLAVEEQFYIVWPIAIVLLYRLGWTRLLRLSFLLVIASTLLASEWLVRGSASATFYLSPPRAWELALGGFLALPNTPSAKRLTEPLSWLGLLLIGSAVVGFDESTRFPGLSALAPCLGTALLVWTGATEKTFVSRLMGFRPLVGVGLISYSLYLWHWPLLVLPGMHLSRPLSLPEAGLALLLSVMLAAATWRFLEQPLRRRSRDRGAMRRTLTMAAVAAALIIAIGLALTSWNGFPGRLPAEAQAIAGSSKSKNPLQQQCLVSHGDALPPLGACVLGEKGTTTVFLWGDSHGDHLAPAVDVAGRSLSFSGRQITKGSCPPLLGATRVDGDGKMHDDCDRFNQKVLTEILSTPSIERVILAARWSLFSENDQGAIRGYPPAFLVDTVSSERSKRNSRRALEKALRATVERLGAAGIQTIIVGQLPETQGNMSKCIARARWHQSDARKCYQTREHALKRLEYSDELIRRVAIEHGNVSGLLPSELLCSSDYCEQTIDDTVLYLDSHHLSADGARALGPWFAAKLSGLQ